MSSLNTNFLVVERRPLLLLLCRSPLPTRCTSPFCSLLPPTPPPPKTTTTLLLLLLLLANSNGHSLARVKDGPSRSLALCAICRVAPRALASLVYPALASRSRRQLERGRTRPNAAQIGCRRWLAGRLFVRSFVHSFAPPPGSLFPCLVRLEARTTQSDTRRRWAAKQNCVCSLWDWPRPPLVCFQFAPARGTAPGPTTAGRDRRLWRCAPIDLRLARWLLSISWPTRGSSRLCDATLEWSHCSLVWCCCSCLRRRSRAR